MAKDKLVICTVGTSIAQRCPSLEEYLKNTHPWEEDTTAFEKEIAQRVEGIQGEIRRISAELNSLERLELTPNSKIILLASDNAAGKAAANQVALWSAKLFGLAPENIEIKRIAGLQVYDAQLLRKEGIQNLIKTILTYLTDANYEYQYDIVLNPTGGYKGVLPFLTVLGMLYGKRSVYIFEHAEQLISLPPLPFSFDIETYNRVKPALDLIDQETAITEQQFFASIIDFVEQERPLFASFIEPIDEHLVSVSPLAEVLLSIENRGALPKVSSDVIALLEKDSTPPALALKRLIKNSTNPLWRKQHSEKWHQTDLIVLKQNATAERVAGFLKDEEFYIAHVFRTHDEYERDLPKYNTKTAAELNYQSWESKENLGADTTDSAALLTERDELLAKNAELDNQWQARTEQQQQEHEAALQAEQEAQQELLQNLAEREEKIQGLEQVLAESHQQLAELQNQQPTTFAQKLRALFS